jgi:hypothetical protein
MYSSEKPYSRGTKNSQTPFDKYRKAKPRTTKWQSERLSRMLYLGAQTAGGEMVEKITDRKLYQVTSTNNHKQAFVLNQQISIRDEHNPFFRFYETVLEYPTTDGQTGGLTNINAVEWLHRVRQKTILTSYEMLAEKAFEVSQHYMMLARELIMEQIRLEEFGGEPPSRQSCLFVSDTIEEAKGWIPLLGGQGAVCELICTGTMHRADSRLMVKVSQPLSVTKDKARAYWRGEASADPRMETLFAGDAVVSAVGL